MVRYWGRYGEFAKHTKGFCWAATSVVDTEEYKAAPSITGKEAYYYNNPDDPGNLIYCEDCLRKMGVLW